MKKAGQRALARLCQAILDGELPGGEQLSEVVVAGMPGVSRTPAKLALARLELAGLVKNLAGRGREVCKASIGDLEVVIKRRRILKGAAAAALVSSSVQEITRKDRARSIEMSQRILLRRRISMDDVAVSQDANTRFHEPFMRDRGNERVALSCAPVRHRPIATPCTCAPAPDRPDKEHLRMSVGHVQHVTVAKAVESSDACRSQTVMREHSNVTFEYACLFIGQSEAGHVSTQLQAV